MSLTDAERDRVKYLLGKQQSFGYLSAFEEQELRNLLERMDAEAKAWGIGALVAFGLGLIAAWALLRDRNS